MMAKINRITPEMVEQAVNDVKTSGHNKYFTQEYMDAHAFDPEDKPDFLLPKQDDTQNGGNGFVGMGIPEGTPDYTSIYYNTSTQDDANRNIFTNIIGQGLVTGAGTALKNIGESLSEPVTPDTYTDVYYNTATQNNAPNENLNALGGVITQGADAAYKALQTTTMYNAAGYAWDEEGRVIKAKQMGEFFHQDPAFFLNNEQSYIQAAKIMASYNIDSRVAPDVDKSDPVAFGQYLNEHYPELIGADLADFQMALRNIEDVKSIHSIGQAVKLAWDLYATQAESADISRAAFLGKYGKYGTDYLPEEAIDRKNWLNEHYKKLRDMIPTLGEHPLLNILTQSGEQLGGMTEDTIKGAAIGGAAAAIAYSIPGVGATTAKSVFATGMKYGSMLGMFWRQVGDKYIEYASYQDENGRPLFTPDEARVRAAIETGLETGIEFYNYDDIMRALSGSGRVAIQNIVARNKGDKEAIIGGLKGYVASAAKSWAPRVKEEVLEEGEQSLVDSAMKAYMLNVERPDNKEEKPTLQGAAYDAADAMVQAVPAVVGMIAAGDVVSNVTAVRKVATIAELHNKLSEEQVDNVVTLNTLKELKENQKVNKLFKKDPDLYKKTVKATMEDAGMPYVFVDTEMLLKEEGGEQLVNQLGKEIGMTDEEIKNVVDSKADLKVPTEIYCQVALPSQLADRAMTMTTSSANLNCEARVKDTVARVQKNIQELSRKDEEERQQVVNNIADNSGFTDAEKELAKEVMLDNPTDVQKGYKDAVKAAEDEVNSIIDPVVERLDKNSEIGDVNGGKRHKWWTDYFGKKTPTETEKRQFAYDVLTAKEPGDLTPVMGQMSEEDVAKWEQDGAEMKKRLDGLIKRRDILRGMADKMAKIDSVETSVTKGLTPEAYRVYRSTADTLGQSKNKDVAKSARFSAIIFARMCQRLADESVKQGKKVTAEDIASTIAINPNASEVVKGGHNQFAWHGSPYNFDKFTLDHIGEGEGQQVHGYGLYFAKNKSISQGYKDKLNKTDSNARLYKVDVPDTKNLLNEQKPFKAMSKGIKSKIKKAFESLTDDEKKTFAKTLIKDEYPSERERELKGERSPLARRLNFLTKIKDGNIGYAKYLDLHRKWLEKTFSLTDSEIDTLKDKDKGPVLAGKLLDEYNKSKGNEFKQIENELAKLQGEREERTRKARESLFDTLENDESVSDFPRYSGKDIYNAFAAAKGSPKLASQTLNDNGISGITYVGADDGRCFVVFNDNAVKIIEKYNQTAWHGSPYDFEHFDTSKMGSGEGNQAHGWGVYTAQDRKTSEGYKARLQDIHLTTMLVDGEAQQAPRLINDLVKENRISTDIKSGKQLVADLGKIVTEEQETNKARESLAKKIKETDFSKTDMDAFRKSLTDGERTVFDQVERRMEGEPRDTWKKTAVGFIEYLLDDGNAFVEECESVQDYFSFLIDKGKNISFSKNKPILYKVDVPENNTMLDENKVLYNQPVEVLKKLSSMKEYSRGWTAGALADIYEKAEAGDKKNNSDTGLKAVKNWFANRKVKFTDDEGYQLIKDLHGDEKLAIKVMSVTNDPALYLNGRDIYKGLTDTYGTPKDASLALNKAGINGITYDGRRDGRCFVIFDDAAVKIIEKYNQQQAAINGQTYRTQAGTFVNIFKTADASTFVHESAHVYLMQMGNLARNENASAQFRSDFMTVQRWLGNSDINDAINVKQHEKFARGFEAYLRNGQAPAPALRSVFTRFKTWLTQIYRDFVQLGGKPTKEIRDVMDRMLATKDEVDLAMKEQMVDDFERAGGLKGANPDVSSKWKEWYGKVREEAEAKVMAQAMKDLEAQQHADFDAMVEAERKNIEGDLMDLPLWKANAIVEDANGDESMLSAFGLTPEEYHKQLEEAGGSFDAAVKRQLDAFRQELESDAASADMISKAAKNAVQTAKYQEMLHGLEYKALEDAVNKMQDKQDQRVRSLVFETVKARRQQARDALAKLPIGEALNLPMWAKKLAQQQYDVSKLIGEKKWREALKAKGDQLMSAAVITEAGRMKARVDKITDDVKKHIATVQKGNDRLPADERYYYTHLAYLLGLSRVDGLQPAELKSLTDVFKGFAGQTAEEEAETVFPGWLENLVNSKDRIGWQSLTAPELEYVSKVMNALYKRGRTKENLNILTKDDGSVMTIAEAVDQLTDDINGHVTPDYRPDKQDLNRPIDKVKRQIHGAADFLGEYFHKLVTPLTLLQRMDGYEGKTGKGVTGHAIKWLYDPIMKATNKETLLKANFANKLTDILSVYGSEMDDIRNKAIYRFGDRILTKEQVMALALNTGTESNYARILDNEPLGKNWNPKSIDDRHGSVQDALTRVFRDALTEKDWNVIMRIWDLMSEHWADESQIKERTTGIPLGKVKTRDFEITTKDGKTIEVKGGYYPIAYDPKQSVKASNLETQDALKSMSPGALRMGQKKSFTKSRADAVTGRPLQLSFDVIPRKGGEMMHYIAFREAALDVSRIVNNKKFTAAVVDALGMESYKTLQSYAADVWAPPVQGNAWYDKVMQKVRTNTTTAVLAYRTSTMLLNAANAPLMIMYCGPGEFFSAFRKFYESPMKNFRFVNGLSPFMAERSERMDTNIRESYQAKHSGVTPLSINDKIMQNGFKLIGATDNMFAYPLWYAEYMRVLNEGINSGKKVEDIQQDAIAAGDRAVVRVIGSGDLKDLSPAQKGGELAKMLTMFYTFQNALYNMAANKFYAGREAARLKGAKGNTFITRPEFIVPMAHFLLCGVMLNSAIEMGIRGAMDAASGRDDDKEKNAAYWFKRFVQGSIENQTATVPILRDIWRPISNIIFEGKPMFSPSTKMTSAFDSFTRIVEGTNTAEGYALGKKNLADMVRDGGRVITALAGAPDMIVDGASAALQYFLYDGGEHDLLDLMAAIAFDRKLPKPKEKAKKLTPYERRLRNAAKTRVKK